MMLVDYGGSIFPTIAHAPWIGLHLADFVMPFFLFIAGVSLAIAYKVDEPRFLSSSSFWLVKFFYYGFVLCFLVVKNFNCFKPPRE